MSDQPATPDQKWFIRVQGKVTGPFDLKQLQTLRARSQFSRIHEISADRKTWQKASTLESLFPTSQPAASSDADVSAMLEPPTGTSPSKPPPPSSAGSRQWFYATNGTQMGPESASVLQQLIYEGRLSPNDLVWQEGLADWVPARSVPDLKFPPPAPTGMGSPNWQQSQMFQQPPETNGLAVASLILGLLWLGGFGSLLAVIFGGVAMQQIKRSRGASTGKGLAVAGLVLGIVGLVPLVIYLLRHYGVIEADLFSWGFR